MAGMASTPTIENVTESTTTRFVGTLTVENQNVDESMAENASTYSHE